MTTRHELSVVDFFLDRIAVASSQWENGLILRAQTGCGAHPASYPMGIGGLFRRGKAAGA
jgi:hypothetical protein